MVTPNKDDDYLDRLRDYYAENRRIPSMQRIAELMAFASKTASRKLLERLAAAGFVQRAPDEEAWIPAGRFFERPLAGDVVRAGYPDPVGGVGTDPFLVDDYLVRHPSRTVMIPVRGDSMLDAGIHDGDIIAVERATEARAGDFVVAVVDGEFTLKELVDRPRPAGDRLVPGNGPSFPSGHPLATAASWCLVPLVVGLYTARRSVWWASVVAAWLLAVAVAASRVWLGVHWTSDVIAGLLLAVLGVFAAERFIDRVHRPGCAAARARGPAPSNLAD